MSSPRGPRPARAARAVAVVLLAPALLVACGGGEPGASGTVTVTDAVTATTTATATVTVTPTPTSPSTAATRTTPTGGSTKTHERDIPAPTSAASAAAEGSGTQVFLVDARVAGHDAVDRVVWELAGDGVPGYRIGWTDDPRRDGSGDPVDLEGDATLEVVLLGVGIPPDAPPGVDVYDGPATLSGRGTDIVTEVEVGTVFEGQLTGFVGAERERAFRVTLLTDPTRVVVDIAR